MLAVLTLELASVLSISFLRSILDSAEVEVEVDAVARCARSAFACLCFSFLVTLAFRSSRAALRGSKSTSVAGEWMDRNQSGVQTSIRRDFCNPLLFFLLILSVFAPSVNPVLLFLVPDSPVTTFLLNALCSSKLFPLGRGFWFRKMFTSW